MNELKTDGVVQDLGMKSAGTDELKRQFFLSFTKIPSSEAARAPPRATPPGVLGVRSLPPSQIKAPAKGGRIKLLELEWRRAGEGGGREKAEA